MSEKRLQVDLPSDKRVEQALKLMELAELKIKELTHEHTVIDQMMSAGSCVDCDVKYEIQSLLEESKKWDINNVYGVQ